MRPVVFVALVGPLLAASPALAAGELITNGDFSATTLSSSTQITGTALNGWTNGAASGSTSYGNNFLVRSGDADKAGFTTAAGTTSHLYGPNGSLLGGYYALNGMPSSSPSGGNYVVASTQGSSSALSQTLYNLMIGQTYNLSFYAAGAEFGGTSLLASPTEWWQVTFGNAVQSTAQMSQAAGGFSSWSLQTMSFVATSQQQTLSFLAVGPTNGTAGAALLDGVSLTAASAAAVPEPASLALLAIGVAGLATLRRPRRA